LKQEVNDFSARIEELNLKEKNALLKVKTIERDMADLITDRNAKLKDIEVNLIPSSILS
jgi:hypothetical protein